MAIHVGIGSWADDAYTGVLYPKDLPRKDRLRDYARTFRHVEVNATYYATPKVATAKGWLAQTPDAFTFGVKLHRAFSQNPARTANAGDLLERLRAGVQPLAAAGRLSGFLLVLPPTFEPERHRLEELDTVAQGVSPHALAVELRHRAWITGTQRQRTLAYFRERRLVWVVVDMPRVEDPSVLPWVGEVTNPAQAYVRLHGRNPNYLQARTAAEGHHYAYQSREIGSLAKQIRRLAEGAKDTFVICNNHAEDFAPRAALALSDALSG